VTAQFPHGDFETGAGTQRRFVEQQGQRVPGQGVRRRRIGAQSAFLLEPGSEGQTRLEGLRVQVENGQIRPTRLVRIGGGRRVRGCVHGELEGLGP
jgi:hypothetical protein